MEQLSEDQNKMEPKREPHHAPQLVSLGSVESLVQAFPGPGSDGGSFFIAARASFSQNFNSQTGEEFCAHREKIERIKGIMEQTLVDQNSMEPKREAYHAPKLVSLGSMESLVQFGLGPGSDGGGFTDCAVFT
jgi:hypothetical protein